MINIRNKITLFIILFIGYMSYTYAQMGINTNNPVGIFHVEANPSIDGILTDSIGSFIVDSDQNGGVIAAISGNPETYASIAFKDSTKALLLNRVTLNSTLGNDPKNSIQNPADGMLVYNTKTVYNSPYSVTTGPYVYSKNYWRQLVYEIGNVDLGDYELQDDGAPIPSLPSTSYNEKDFLEKAKRINFKNINNQRISNKINIASTAAYAVALELNGPTTNGRAWTANLVYLAAVSFIDENNPKVLDSVLITPIVGANSSTTAYSTILGFNSVVGDKISIMILQANDSDLTWTLDQSSRITIWRL